MAKTNQKQMGILYLLRPRSKLFVCFFKNILITVPANIVSNLSRNCNNGVSFREYIEKLKDKSENESTKNGTGW